LTQVRAITMATALCTMASACASPQQANDHWVPTLAEVQDLESHLVKPGPAQLAKSTRFYYGFYDNGMRVIRGEILADGVGSDMQIHIMQGFPMIADGGCGIIHLSYDPAKHRVLSLRCNGVA
jgi:hypothetical protein